MFPEGFMRLLKRVLLIVLAVITVAAGGCVRKEKSDKEVVAYFKSIDSYKCQANITITNDRQDIEYECNVFYDGSKGGRIELGKDRVFLYKNDKIEVQDNISNRRYSVEESFDNLFYLTFINEYIKLMYVNEDTKYYIEEANGKRFQLIELTIPDNNRNMAKAVLYVDAKALVPEKILIYDNKGKERIRFTYLNFAANEKLDDKLFSF
jgi:outer membrane lipoprotein-sorting protein